MVRIAFAEDVSLFEVSINDKVSLGQNVPNPAHNISTIAYELVSSENVQFEVYDLTGKIVMTINEGSRPAGVNSIVLNTEDLNSGIYYYSIIIDGDRLTKKMVVTKSEIINQEKTSVFWPGFFYDFILRKLTF